MKRPLILYKNFFLQFKLTLGAVIFLTYNIEVFSQTAIGKLEVNGETIMGKRKTNEKKIIIGHS